MVKIDFQVYQIGEVAGPWPLNYINAAILVIFLLFGNPVFLYICYS